MDAAKITAEFIISSIKSVVEDLGAKVFFIDNISWLEQNGLETSKEANKLIESKIGRLVNHLAYPFGGPLEINHREIAIVKSLNLKTAVTTRNGNIFLEHKNFIESLPRIMLTEKFNIQDIGRIKRRRVATL